MYNSKTMILSLLLIAQYWWQAMAADPIPMPFTGQLIKNVDELKEKVARDPKLKGQKLKFTQINSAIDDRDAANSVLKIESFLKSELKSILDSKAENTLEGKVAYIKPDSGDNRGFHVLQIKLVASGPNGKELFETIEREVNDTDDINAFLQNTIAPSSTKSYPERNADMHKARVSPKFALIPGSESRVCAVGETRYSLEVRRKVQGKGESLPVPVTDVDGLAFASVDIGDTYEVFLYNHDPETDSVAKLEIDGVDVVNQFNKDITNGQKFPGYFVPRGTKEQPGVHPVPGWYHTASKAPGVPNAFKFKVNKLGEGVASEVGLRSNVGGITVQFFDACEPNGKLRNKTAGETAKGEGMQVDYDLKPVVVATKPTSIISIRYTRTP